MPKFSLAIIGAGLSGLSLAIALQTLAPDIEFELYEGASELSAIGAGIGIVPRAWAIMQAIGLEGALLKVAGDGRRPTISHMHRKSDQAEGIDMNIETHDDESHYSFHRAEIQSVFLEHLQPTHPVRTGKRFVSYRQPADGVGPIELLFHDGSTATCDVLIGSDGIRSSVRASMYSQLADSAQAAGRNEDVMELRSYIAPHWTGEVVYRCLIKKDALPEDAASHPAFNHSVLIVYCGKNRHLVTYPISQGRMLNVGAGITVPEEEGTVYEGPWTSSAEREEIVKHYVGWEPEVQEIVKHINGGLKWVVNVVGKLPSYIDGRVALAGDAAHAMGQHLGAGAGQCFEDAFMLVKLLGRPDVTRANISAALQVYDEIRRPFTQDICARARRRGQLHHLNGPDFAELTAEQSATGEGITTERLLEIGAEMERLRDWHNGPSVAEDNMLASKRLDELLSSSQV